jgi:signal transduction histidine kinase/DNA-binding response OmpR family regulator
LDRKPEDWLIGGGEMGKLIRSMDWAQTPLGPIESWPQSLCTTVSLCLASNFPISLVWGPNHVQIYNDGYWPICGGKHPHSMGQDFTQCWASAWPVIGEAFACACTGETSYLEDQRIFIDRNGYLEETFFTFSFSPIRDETGAIGGLFHPVTETTSRMLSERRTRGLRDLATRTSKAQTMEEACKLTVEALAEYELDVPFALFYVFDALGKEARLTASTGIKVGTLASPVIVNLEQSQPSGWPWMEVAHSRHTQLFSNLERRFEHLAVGPYPESPKKALALPIIPPGCENPIGLLIAGVSSRLPLTESYRVFYELTAAAVTAAVANARAREEEIKRTRALAEIDRAKTAFFSNISHEFRTPLTLLLGPLEDELAERTDPLPAERRERLEAAHRNSLRLLKLVNTLLDFSRIEAGRVQANYQRTDLAAFTAELAGIFRSAIEKAALVLAIDCPALPEMIYVDQEMWEKIVLNLLSNALKHTFEGCISVKLSWCGDHVKLVVADSGIGIPEAALPHLFERFHRVEGARSRSNEGTGIGLALVRELVSFHGGTVRAESQENKGSTFTVTIKAGTAHLPSERVSAKRDLTATAAQTAAPYVVEALQWLPNASSQSNSYRRSDDADVRILLADDNADMRDYLKRVLEDGGFAVEAVNNGRAALDAIKRATPPDLVLTDVMMPELDGFGLLAAVRGDPDLEGLLVILLSARAGEEARLEGLAAGADDYLVKPFGARELRARVDGAINLARLRRRANQREQELRAEIVLERNKATLRQTEQQLDIALQAGRLGSWELQLQSGQFVASALASNLFGIDTERALNRYQDVVARIHPDDRQQWQNSVDEASANGGEINIECRVLTGGTQTKWLEVRGRLCSQAGLPVRLCGVCADVTTRKSTEEHQRLLLDELNHRVKNTLATVQSIAVQTLRPGREPVISNNAFMERIFALAQAHDLLTEGSWQGASLADVVERTMIPYIATGQEGRVTRSGPEVRLSPNAAVTLNMAFHELATNAVKYGALNSALGRVDIRWSLNETNDRIDIDWRESGGPSVAHPAQRGFGSRLIEFGLAHEMEGDAEMRFLPDGLWCHMCLPLSAKIALVS